MFLDDPEFCLEEEHSQELIEEYSLTYHYQTPVEFLPNCKIIDSNKNISENPSDECSFHQEDSLDFSTNFFVSSRDLIFIPEKNKIKNNIENDNDNDNENNNSNNDVINNNGNKMIKNKNVNSSKRNEMKSNKKNIFMPVKSAIFILKNSNLISENIFLEMRRCEEILNRRLRLRRKLRNSLETVNLFEIRQNVKNTDILYKLEVTIIISYQCFSYFFL